MPGGELTGWHLIFPAKSRVPRHNGVVITCSHCGTGWISAEEVGQVLNPHQPLTAVSARREMNQAGKG